MYGSIINTDIFHDMGIMGKYRQIKHGNMVDRVGKKKRWDIDHMMKVATNSKNYSL